jgi:hypothetical protein
MRPSLPEAILLEARAWDHLTRPARVALARELRSVGLSYGEIRAVVPVASSTLSTWCRDVDLTPEQRRAISDRARRSGGRRDTQRRRRLAVEEIRRSAAADVPDLIADPLWLAGTMLYWAEGAKTTRKLDLGNTDPDILRIFVAWVRHHHDPAAEFSLALHLHEVNDEDVARTYWEEQLGLERVTWQKTFVKPKGTGHRRNHVPWGVCRVRPRRSADAFVRTEGWITGLRRLLADHSGTGASLAPGR